ncbi:hypothetical protein M501DRAFT_1000051 [Patellaria atrata CBS 101060]|uniref:Mus7/MMS22 family-domain-containing protein n=1 Tax=Patellaria atrata CBS 101060 TaxID=1346257 RepID=A0A9P4S1E2_9PEZI|nr:hypothetical protein M501DRAFT_1000051 [Patellaria atrata CBS 101060]
MKSWRQTGFVQDSDEDEELNSDDSQSRERVNNNQQYPLQISGISLSGISLSGINDQAIEPQVNHEDLEEITLVPAVCSQVNVVNRTGIDIEDDTNTDDGQQDLPAQASDRRLSISTVLELSDSSAENQSHHISPAPSSPLTEFSSSPVSDRTNTITQSQENPISHTHRTGNTLVRVDISPRCIARTVDIDGVPANIAQRTAGRTFRQRKAIQLHPYMLENELYKRTLKTRGIRPVNLGFPPGESQPGAVQDDIQYQEMAEDDIHTDTQPITSSNTSSILQLHDCHGLRSSSAHLEPVRGSGEDDEFPDLATLIERNAIGHVQNGPKRRKTAHVSLSDRQDASNTLVFPGSSSSLTDNACPHNVFDVPSFPPISSQTSAPQSPQRPAKRLYIPEGISPDHLRTPLQSSRTERVRHIVISEENEESVSSRANLNPQISHTNIIDVSSSSDSEGSQSSGTLRYAEKKIKGVLPASWLTLDRQAQTSREAISRASRRHTSPSHVTSTDQRGVARRVLTRVVSSRNEFEAAQIVDTKGLLLEDSGSSNEPEHTTKAMVTGPVGNKQLVNVFNDESYRSDGLEVEEDNWVEPMFPSTSRTRTIASEPRKRQLKLTSSFRASGKGVSTTQTKAHISTHIVENPSKRDREHAVSNKRKVRVRPPRLSILDVKPSDLSVNGTIPDFIRVAVRSARRRPDEARHSPTQKHIRLLTYEDTEDANIALHSWRAGKIAPRTAPARREHAQPSRKPLADVTIQCQQLLPRPHQQPSSRSRSHGLQQRKDDGLTLLSVSRPKHGKLKPYGKAVPDLEEVTFGPQLSTKKHGTSLRPNELSSSRTAQLEAPEALYDARNRKTAFRKSLALAEKSLVDFPRDRANLSNHQLARFLAHEETIDTSLEVSHIPDKERTEVDIHGQDISRNIVRKARKSQARHIPADSWDFLQMDEPLPVTNSSVSVSAQPSATSILCGFAPFGSRYSMDFNVRPLQRGTYFHQGTFIGSGEFRLSLTFTERDFDVTCRHEHINIDGHVTQLDCWNNAIATQLSILASTLKSALRENDSVLRGEDNISRASSAMRSIIRYISKNLSFSEAVDWDPFVTKMLEIMQDVKMELVTQVETSTAFDVTGLLRLLRLLALQLVVISQVEKVSTHGSVAPESAQAIRAIKKEAALILVKHLLRKGMDPIRTFLEENNNLSVREAGIQDKNPAVECIVILFHIFPQLPTPSGYTFWDLVAEELLPCVKTEFNVQILDRVWFDIFSLLPLLEFDSQGLLKLGQRYQISSENWIVIKTMLTHVFFSYAETLRSSNTTVNSYVRAVMGRCHHLIQHWGWRRCEPILNVIFDFYARKGLNNLSNEEVRGSAAFLERLEYRLSLDIQPEDKSFQIFLKLLATGLINMQDIYPDEKIHRIAWRFMPLNGRIYHKEENLAQEDLDALRNHHDLLTTIYWSSPSSLRPRLDVIRDLVSHDQSHREACHLNVRAWSNLVRYQISTDEPLDRLGPFAAWHKDIIERTIAQFRLARTEAEAFYPSSHVRGTQLPAPEIIESTIDSNQRQVLATLSEAVTGMKSAIQATNKFEHASMLLKESNHFEVLKLFDAKSPHVNTIVMQCMEVAKEYFNLVCNHWQQITNFQQESEESQDYGEWPEFDDIMGLSCELSPRSQSIAFVHDAVAILMFSAFGAEGFSNNGFLSLLVNLWARAAQYHLKSREREWSDYFDHYSPISWYQLRYREQTPKYAPYFMTSLIEFDGEIFHKHSFCFISSWLLSLVERDCMLKFQHRFTSALLNIDSRNQLLAKLPFSPSRKGVFQITLEEFRIKRTSVISCVLANMQESYEETVRRNMEEGAELQRDYAEILKQLMATMKSHYLYNELHEELMVKDAYVNFIQCVVEYLQQYTTDICPVDRFFTDSSAFPLPATDPTYVVGQLKGYSTKLTDAKTTKKLVAFFQAVSERAATDNQQSYLAGQLHSAFLGQFEDGKRILLRQVFLQDIFPAYIQAAFLTSTGWIIAIPVFQTIRLGFDDMLSQFSSTDSQSEEIVESILDDTLQIFQQTVGSWVDHRRIPEQKHVFHILSHVFDIVTAAMPVVDYIYRRIGRCTIAADCVHFFKDLSIFVGSSLLGVDAIPPMNMHDQSLVPSFSEIREFVSKGLNQSIQSYWTLDGNTYFVTRGGMRKQVEIVLGELEEEKERVISSIEAFHSVLGRMEGLEGKNGPDKEVLPSLRSIFI